MKAYFELDFENNSKIIGRHFPQLESFEGGNSYQSSTLFDHIDFTFKNFRKEEYKIPQNVFLGIGKIKHTVKLTDLLSDRYNLKGDKIDYIIVSTRFRKLLEMFHLGNHRFFNLPILYKKQLTKYYFLVTYNPIEKCGSKTPCIVQVKEEYYIRSYFSDDLIKSMVQEKISGFKQNTNKIIYI